MLPLALFVCTSCNYGNKGSKTASKNDTSVSLSQRQLSETEMETETDSTSMDLLYTMEGELRIGHEVRAFTPSGSDREFWIVDKTGQLLEKYDKITKGQKNGKPVKATLRLEYNGKWDDGFAAEYDGTYLVREVVELKAE